METEIIRMKVRDLVPYDRNPRVNDPAVKSVMDSLERYGYVNRIIVDKDNVVVGGHTRLKAMMALGWGDREIDVIRYDAPADKVREYRIVDNSTADIATWDYDLLQGELDELPDFNVSDYGMDLEEVEIDDEPTEAVEDGFVPDDEPRNDHGVRKGDVWILGDHCLMCGDSTRHADVERLMDGNHADITFTSPPYNMAQSGHFDTAPRKAMNAGRAYTGYTDDLSDEDYSEMLSKVLDNACEFSDDVMLNIGVLAGSRKGIANMIGSNPDRFFEILTWVKSSAMPTGLPSMYGKVTHDTEPIFCFHDAEHTKFQHPQWTPGGGHNMVETRNNAVKDDEGLEDHHAGFPVAFAFEICREFSEDSVLDLFGGTGTTMIACEQLGRTCYMMEIDPHYCDTIIRRWEAYTGRKAVKLED